MSTIVRSTPDWEVELGQRVRLARKRTRLSQQALAARSNVSLSAVKSLEAGRGSTLRTFVSVVRALGLDTGLDRIFASPATVSPVAMLHARGESTVGG
jgi:transcriptional regulator with XRE-family HTH domain